ncbi:MAG: aminopeptidase [Bacteroidaceae bacterium]|nr:aminopeptidase [Bacteroidaceae bacterium]
MKRTFLSFVGLLLVLAVAAQTECERLLRTSPHVVSVEAIDNSVYPEKYIVKIEQNVNGTNSQNGTFTQRLIVGLKGLDRPTVMVTEGYFAHYALNPNYEDELSRLFDANVIVCEYRYFGESAPEGLSPLETVKRDMEYWRWMTVDNSLADLHRVRQSLGTVFHGKWIATGISKGGQTTMFYRATYPNDMDVSVSYVAPLNRSVEDGRHEKFLAKQVGTREERAAVKAAQQELMRRKTALMPRFEKFCSSKDYHFNAPMEEIYDFCVLELPFALWQWGTPVSVFPASDASDDAWFQCLTDISEPNYLTCPSEFTPFYVQAMREIGFYGYSCKGLKKWQSIKTAEGYLPRLFLPEQLRSIKFDNTLYKRTCKYLKENDPKHIFIYGEIDAWSASGVAGWLDCSKKKQMCVYVQPRGSHHARISNMPDEMKADIMSRLTEWLK